MKRYIFPGSIAFTIFLFSFIFYQLFFVSHEPFPKLTPGKYIGFFSGSLIGSGVEKVFFSVEAEQKTSILHVIIYSTGWGAKSFDINTSSDEKSGTPLIVPGPEVVLRFGGRSVSPEYIAGKVINVSSGEDSNWVLYANSDIKTAALTPEQSQLPALGLEEVNLEMRLKAQAISAEKLSVEQARLTKALSEGKTLEQKAENRFTEKQGEIDNLKLEIAKAEKTVSDMQASLAVARSITQKGRLTTMARESLTREFREINFKLSGDSREEDAALLAELARAKEALALQQELLGYSDSYDRQERTAQ